MLSPPHKSRHPSRSPRESPRAQIQNELPSRYKYKYLHHPHTAMHVKVTGRQADHRIRTPGIIRAVRGNSALPVPAWGAASTEGGQMPLISRRSGVPRPCNQAGRSTCPGEESPGTERPPVSGGGRNYSAETAASHLAHGRCNLAHGDANWQADPAPH